MSSQLILLVLLVSIGLIGLYNALFKHSLKGHYGESVVALQLSRLNSKKYRVLHDILITTDLRSSQIDHIVISCYGIHVIETKNLSGWIFGHEKSNKWTQTLYKNKYQFRNPINQTWGHITTLKSVLSDQHHTPYFPIVVFTGKSELKRITATIPVIKSRKLIQCIIQDTKICIPDEAVDKIYEKLQRLNKTDVASRKTHIHKARSNQSKKLTSTNCPSCGSKLSLRNGQYGAFYGCSNYPKCKFTKKHNH